LRRLLALETHLFDTEMVRREKHIDKEFDIMGPDARLAYVFQKMADEGHAIAMVIRYEGSLNRSYDKAFKQLLVLQSRRDSPPPAPNKKIQNEPKPDPAEQRPQGAVTNQEPAANPESATNHESISPPADPPNAAISGSCATTPVYNVGVSRRLHETQPPPFCRDARCRAGRPALGATTANATGDTAPIPGAESEYQRAAAGACA
jgi:hypothetical protein